MKKRSFYKLSVPALVLTGFFIFNTCSIDDTDSNEEHLNKTELQDKIAEAKTEQSNTMVGTSDDNVRLGRRWVSQQVMTAFEAAVVSAESVLTSASAQTELNAEAALLDSALEAFKKAVRTGTAAPEDTGVLVAKIAEAESAKAAVVIGAGAEDVPVGMQWVTQADMNTFNNAIRAARATLSNALNQTAVNAAVLALDNAINIFISALQSGSKTDDFTAEELAVLIENAKTIKANIKTSNNGNDVGPADTWVRASILNALNDAITGAESAGENIDGRYLTLLAAIDNFNNAKTTGTVPNKTNLYNAIVSADNVRAGVIEAVNAAQAPYDSSWATTAQLAALNTAYNSALAVYDNANASLVMVTGETAGLNAAIQTFTLALQTNGPGMRQNTVKITALNNDQNGKTVIVGLFSTLAEMDGSFAEPAIHGFGEIANGEATVTLIWYNSSDFFTENGSWYVGLTISDGSFDFDNTEFYLCKSTIDFTAEYHNPAITFSDFESLWFSFRLGDIVGDAIFEGGLMTFNALFTALAGAEVNFDDMMQEAGITYYKDQAFTQSFTGSDLVGADTIIYSPFPYSL